MSTAGSLTSVEESQSSVSSAASGATRAQPFRLAATASVIQVRQAHTHGNGR